VRKSEVCCRLKVRCLFITFSFILATNWSLRVRSSLPFKSLSCFFWVFDQFFYFKRACRLFSLYGVVQLKGNFPEKT